MSTPLFSLGCILLLHAAYSCLHYRELLQELEESSVHEIPESAVEHLLMDVIVEVVVGFLSLLLSELIRPGSALRPINSPHQTLMAPPYRSRDFDFYATLAIAL